MRDLTKAGNFQSRAFVFEDGIYACGIEPVYFESVGIDSLAQDRGDITEFEKPSDSRYGHFEKFGGFSGEISRVTTTLSTYMKRTSTNEFLRMFKNDCPFDLHIHFGSCQNPTNFDDFDMAIILTDVRATSWGTDPLSVLTSGDKALIEQTLDVSAREIYELFNLSYGEVASTSTVDGGFVAALVADQRSCGGECEGASDGCQAQFAVTDDGFIYYSQNAGSTWAKAEAVDTTANPTSLPIDLMFVGDMLVILCADDMLYFTDRSEFLLDPTVTWDSVDVSGSIALAAGKGFANKGYVVGDAGVIAYVDIYGNLTVVDNGEATSENLAAVDLYGDVIVAGGANGEIVVSENDGVTWSPITSPTSTAISSVLIKSEDNWLVGDEDGALWCTSDGGNTWTAGSYPGSTTATTPLTSLVSPMAHVVYMIQNNRLLRSINGGNSWQVEPSNSKKAFPTLTLAAVAVCSEDINTVTVVGENAATGSIVVGKPIG